MKYFLLALLQVGTLLCNGQTFVYKSRLVNESGEPVPFATIKVTDTQTVTSSTETGEFSFPENRKDFEIEISSVGFQTKRVTVTNGVIIPVIALQASSEELSELVVTALGIEREKQSLASSVSIIEGKDLTEVPLTNLVNSLAGQVAGVQITNGSSGVGSSSRIVIRGENSLSGGNQPLFVIDGVPISNEQISSNLTNNGRLQEVDYGNGGAEIGLEDIASITVLKGAGSAALYGTRAANGVVLITTKRGGSKKGMGLSINSAVTVEDLLTLPDYQDVYGGGSNGQYSFQNGIGAGVNDGGISSYGPKLDEGLLIKQFDSPSVDVNGNPVRGGDVISRTRPDGSFTEITPTPWIARPNNVRDFFETGVTNQNNIALSTSGDRGSSRISYSNLNNKGILPNTGLNRDGIALSLDQLIGSKFSLNTFVNYINSRSKNRPNMGYGYENVMYGFNWTGRQTDISSLKDYWQAGQSGIQHYDFNYLWLTNPYLTLYENTNSFNKNRVLGNMSANYDISSKLSLSLRTGLDTYADKRKIKRAVSTNSNPFGSYREDNVNFKEQNTDLLLTYKEQDAGDFKYYLSLGANRFDQSIEYSYTEASQLALPGIYSLTNSRSPLVGESLQFLKRINSIYTNGNVGFKNMLFLDLTFRNDWSSTLPAEANSFGYYSAGLSYAISNMFALPEVISYLNLRLSAASVGNDTNPYQNAQTFRFNQNYGPQFRVTNETVLKNASLKPERLNALEAGFQLWMLNDRIQLDVSAYQNTSIDQIISRPISNSSGFANFNVNGGEVRTRGLEALLSAELIRKSSFTWQSSVNFSQYCSVVTRLPEGVNQFVTGVANVFGGSGGSNTVFYIARENGRVGDMYGSGFVQVDGKTLYGANGLPVQDGTLRLLGNYNPDFAIGFNNKFTYKALSVNVLMDWRQGGTIVSRTKALGSTSGVLEETLVGREDGVIGDGVVNTGTADNPVYVPNTTKVPASQFYNNFFDRGNEASALYDASYVKIRQVGLYLNCNELAQKLKMQSLKLGLIGSNLFLFTENPHFDPELNGMQETNQVYGVEDFSYPSTRSFGLSIKTEF